MENGPGMGPSVSTSAEKYTSTLPLRWLQVFSTSKGLGCIIVSREESMDFSYYQPEEVGVSALGR